MESTKQTTAREALVTAAKLADTAYSAAAQKESQLLEGAEVLELHRAALAAERALDAYDSTHTTEQVDENSPLRKERRELVLATYVTEDDRTVARDRAWERGDAEQAFKGRVVLAATAAGDEAQAALDQFDRDHAEVAEQIRREEKQRTDKLGWI